MRSCRRKSNFRPKTRQVLRCLLIMIIVCIAMNTMTLVSIGYHISMRQQTLVDVFNASMRLYATAASHKYAIDEIQFVLQCCGHSSYTDWFLFDWQVSLQYYICLDYRYRKHPRRFAEWRWINSPLYWFDLSVAICFIILSFSYLLF